MFPFNEFILASCRQDNFGAEFGEFQGEIFTDPAGSAGDDDDFVVKFFGVQSVNPNQGVVFIINRMDWDGV